MPRYASQKVGSYDCGPIALLNVLKWSGRSVSVSANLQPIKRQCKYLRGRGVYKSEFTYTLKKYKSIKFYERWKTTIGQIDKHLKEGGIVVLLTSRRKPNGVRAGHYWTITEKSGGCYYAHNFRDYDGRYKANTYLLRNEVVRYLRRSLRSHREPHGWFIKKI